MLYCVSFAVLLLCLESVRVRGLGFLVGLVGGDVLRARKRSSERTAMAFMRRTETDGRGWLVGFERGMRVGGFGVGVDVCTLEETAEGEEEGGHFRG